MRIAIGSLVQATDHSVSKLTRMEAFTAVCFLRDQEVLTGPGAIPGFISVLRAANADIVPLIAAEAGPGGPLMRETFHVLAVELVHRLAARGPVDGVLLALHAGMAVEDEPDAAAEIIERVRNVLPAGLPIGVTLAAGSGITPRMRQSGVFFVEPGETGAVAAGERAARLLLGTRRG